jgi:DNA repair protein RadA/Sms
MAKVEKDPFRCSECGWTSQKWVGRCGECQAWGSVEELAAPKKLSLVPGSVTSKATPIGDVDLSSARARATGVSELDRVLGGGLVPGAAILLAGEPVQRKEFLRSISLAKNLHHKFAYAQNESTQLILNSSLHLKLISAQLSHISMPLNLNF